MLFLEACWGILSKGTPLVVSVHQFRTRSSFRVGDALDRIAGRLSRGDKFMRAVTEIEANYEALEIDFLGFFPDLAAFCTEWKHRRENGAGIMS
jgi:hypothetical protein